MVIVIWVLLTSSAGFRYANEGGTAVSLHFIQLFRLCSFPRFLKLTSTTLSIALTLIVIILPCPILICIVMFVGFHGQQWHDMA